MQQDFRSRSIIFILSSPSGAGKSTLAKRLMDIDQSLLLSISVTTRPPRAGEVNLKDYTFVDKKEFEEMIKNDSLIEYAYVYGNYYGTPKSNLEKLDPSRDIIFDISVEGADKLKSLMPKNVVNIYILPPSLEVLKLRLKNRNNTHDLESRISKVSSEVRNYYKYDYLVVNDNIEDTLEKLKSIINAERLKVSRQDLIENKLIKNFIV